MKKICQLCNKEIIDNEKIVESCDNFEVGFSHHKCALKTNHNHKVFPCIDCIIEIIKDKTKGV